MRTVILGGSAAGMGVAAKLMRLNPKSKITVIQKETYVSLGACGIPYFIGNHFNQSNDMIARSVEAFQRSGIEIFINTEAQKIDFDNKVIYLNNWKKIEYDNLVITVGSTPIKPQIKNIEAENIFSVSTKKDAEVIKQSLIDKENVLIIGSGLIGLEMAENIFAASKAKITIIEKSDRPASSLFDKEFTDLIESKIKEKFIRLIKNDEIMEFIVDQHNKVVAAKLLSGKEIQADLIILSIGVKPNTAFLENSGLELSPQKAIIIDEYCQTNLPNVYAGGDCVETEGFLFKTKRPFYLATVANKHAKVIAKNIKQARASKFEGALGTTIVRFFELELARSGENRQFLANGNILTKEVLIEDKDFTSYVEDSSQLLLRIIMDEKTRQIVNVQMAGTNKAVMRIYAVIAMMWGKIKVDEFLEQIDLPYSPPFSRTTDIIHIALSKLN